ncbi:LuxR C-terminal-related transcriptional regulator [Limnohabitans planktonicus]|jgi:DNA-binding NarL/FixJ family response regulator|uniref:DNA-binding response regulator n=1 Tax=Limnohabitans planktonicus II-D5 TaxID=1293045 RepID=A0A2T7UER6_9BURK|nr:DNA-binding response regulator [Limnohabitans planktonicus II-D5]
MPIRVLLSSKHKAVSEGIAALLRTHHDMDLVGMADGDSGTLALCDEVDPDVVLFGMHSNDAHDLTLMQQMALRHPPINTVAFCSPTDRNAIIEILDAGAKGYVSTTSSIDELMTAIRAAAAGRLYLCQSAASDMMDSVRKARSGDINVRRQLGGREEQVLRLIADGYSSKEIARNLQIAPSTVEVHRRNIMRKVGLHKVADLTRYAIRNQMVSI